MLLLLFFTSALCSYVRFWICFIFIVFYIQKLQTVFLETRYKWRWDCAKTKYFISSTVFKLNINFIDAKSLWETADRSEWKKMEACEVIIHYIQMHAVWIGRNQCHFRSHGTKALAHRTAYQMEQKGREMLGRIRGQRRERRNKYCHRLENWKS